MKNSQSAEECCEFDVTDVSQVKGFTRKVSFGCGNVYVTVNEISLRPVRVFVKVGKAGCCQRVLLEAIGRLLTIMLERGDPLNRMIHTLMGIRCGETSVGSTRHRGSDRAETCYSCIDAIAKELREYAPPEDV